MQPSNHVLLLGMCITYDVILYAGILQVVHFSSKTLLSSIYSQPKWEKFAGLLESAQTFSADSHQACKSFASLQCPEFHPPILFSQCHNR